MIDLEKPYLVIDASSPTLHAGVLQNKTWLSLEQHSGDTLESLTQLVDACLQEASIKLEQIHGFIFCEGPGSLLGLRLSAMAVNTWKVLANQKETASLFCYKSLIALGLQLPQYTHIISPFRKGLYNHYDSSKGKLSLIDTETAEKLEDSIAFLPQRRLKQKLNETWQEISYSLENLPAIMDHASLLKQVNFADAWVPEETEYVRWDQKRHR